MKMTPSSTRKAKKYMAVSLAVFLIMPLLLIHSSVSDAAENDRGQYRVYDQKIARGIFFQANNYSNYQGHREQEYIITADLNDPSVQLISAKAGDQVLKLSTLSSQIAQEQKKGQNVAAGINGDMFNISLGTSHYGEPQGIQVMDGKLLAGFQTSGSQSRFPVFAVDSNNQAMISYLSMDNQLSVIDPDYEQVHGSANPNLTTAIDTINRINTGIMNDRMIMLTRQLSDHPVVGFTDEQAVNGTLTVLKNISGNYQDSVKLGQEYEAEVAAIIDTSRGSKSIEVPADGIVLASQGIKAAWMKERIKIGDKVRFSFNLKDQSNKRLDIQQAVTAWLPLVENGRALTRADMLEKCKYDWDQGRAVIDAGDKARTAIGFTRDNKVVALVFDGGGAGKDSYGIDLPGIAARMQELGVVAAVSLDGGGSSQMNTRLFGEKEVNLINQPSDGSERPVSNTILFASNVPQGDDVSELMVNRDIIIYKNTSYQFQVRGQDSYGNPVDLSNAGIRWSLIAPGEPDAESAGWVDQKGLFTAGGRGGSLVVEASLGEVKGTAKVTVVDTADKLAFTESGMLAVEQNVPQALQLTAFTAEGHPLVIDNHAARWSVIPSSMAVVDQQGIFTPLGPGTGAVMAQVGSRQVTLNFVSGQKNQLIDSYETKPGESYQVNGYVGGSCTKSSEQVREGQYSLKVNYDYSAWDRVYNGTINVKVKQEIKDSQYTSLIRPKKLGVWVYGDGKAPWLRAIIKDGNGNYHTINLASRIDWIGWKYVSADIPANIPLPLTLDYYYMVETDKSKNLQGTVYFDDLRFIYLESF